MVYTKHLLPLISVLALFGFLTERKAAQPIAHPSQLLQAAAATSHTPTLPW